MVICIVVRFRFNSVGKGKKEIDFFLESYRRREKNSLSKHIHMAKCLKRTAGYLLNA